MNSVSRYSSCSATSLNVVKPLGKKEKIAFKDAIRRSDFIYIYTFISTKDPDQSKRNDFALKCSLDTQFLQEDQKIIYNAIAYEIICYGYVSSCRKIKALKNAVLFNKWALVKALIAHVDLNCFLEQDLLKIAVEYGYVEVVKILVSNSFMCANRQNLLILLAAEYGHLEIIKILLKEGQIAKSYLAIAVNKAAKHGHLKVVKWLLQKIPTAHWFSRMINTVAQNEITCDITQALCDAAASGHLAIVQNLLAHGGVFPDLFSESYYRLLSLDLAAKNGHLEVVKALIANGGFISEDQRGALAQTAAINNHLAVVREFLADGAIISENARRYIIHTMAQKGHLAALQFLIQDHPLTQRHIEELVLVASSKGYKDVLAFILDQGPIRESVRNFAKIKAGKDPQAVPDSIEDILALLETARIIL